MCAKPFSAVLIVSTLFEKTVGDPDPPSTVRLGAEPVARKWIAKNSKTT